VIDAAITLSVLQGRDPADPVTLAYPAGQPADYAAQLRPDALRGARLGWWRVPELGPEVHRLMSAAVRVLRDRGATVVEVSPPYRDRIGELEFPVLQTEFHRDIDAYLASRAGAPRDLAELIAYNRADPFEQTCFASQNLFEESLAAPAADDPGYRARRAELSDLARRCLDEPLTGKRLDAIIAPTNPPAWLTNCATGDPDVCLTSSPAAVSGYPAITVPAGFVGPLPIGITFMAERFADAHILAFAAEFERVSAARRPPRLRPTLPAGG
jgi:amidase